MVPTSIWIEEIQNLFFLFVFIVLHSVWGWGLFGLEELELRKGLSLSTLNFNRFTTNGDSSEIEFIHSLTESIENIPVG
jgi:hypothetical protein